MTLSHERGRDVCVVFVFKIRTIPDKPLLELSGWKGKTWVHIYYSDPLYLVIDVGKYNIGEGGQLTQYCGQ